MKFGFHMLPVGFGEALKIEVVAGEVFEACQVEGCGAVVAGNVVGGLSGGCDKDGVYVDHVDHVVEFLGLIRGEWLPVSWPVYGAIEGDRP